MNVPGMIRRLKGKRYRVTRAVSDGSYSTVDGSFVQGDTRALYVLGSLQPLTAQELLSIPEGDRTRERYRFYSFHALNTNDTGRLRKGDTVSVNGSDFRVDDVEHWPGYGMATIAKVNTDAN